MADVLGAHHAPARRANWRPVVRNDLATQNGPRYAPAQSPPVPRRLGLFRVQSRLVNHGTGHGVHQGEVGIRAHLRPLERAAFFEAYGNKKLKNIIQSGSGAFGNAATRLEAYVVKGGTYAYGNYPDIDELFQQQAVELDQKKRAAILEKVQQLLHEKAIYAPIWQLAFINGFGPRVGESGFGLIPAFAYTGPYEEITLKGS